MEDYSVSAGTAATRNVSDFYQWRQAASMFYGKTGDVGTQQTYEKTTKAEKVRKKWNWARKSCISTVDRENRQKA